MANYKLGIPAAEANSGIKTGAAASKTPGLLLSDGKGGIKGAVPGTDYGYPLIRGNNPPTANTAANLGQMYFDMMARQEPYMYVCVGSTQYGFVWCVLGGEVIDNGGEDDPTINSGAVPPHGSTGQVLKKISDADYDYEWGEAVPDGSIGLLQLADSTKALSFTVVLTADGWNDNKQTVSSADFVATGYAYSVAPASSFFNLYGEAGICADDVTTDGEMRFNCADVPEVDLTVNVTRVVSV